MQYNDDRLIFSNLYYLVKARQGALKTKSTGDNIWDRLSDEAEQGRGALEKELATANRDHGKLVDAIIAGIPADQVKDKMQALTERREALEAQLAHTPAPDPIRIQTRPRSHE